MKKAKHEKSGGFTLIELLVVISIISVLISIMLPALGAARKTARRLQCGINLKGLAFAATAYRDDYKGRYPYQKSLGGSDSNGLDVMYPSYINTATTYRCPDEQVNAVPTDINNSAQNWDSSSQMSYLYLYPGYGFVKDGYSKMNDWQTDGPMIEDLGGGEKNLQNYANHAPYGGNVVFLDGRSEWHDSEGWNIYGWGNMYKIGELWP